MQTDLQFRKIYLDICCLSRLFDPPTQARVLQEAGAIGHILTYIRRGDWVWISSDVLTNEVNQTPDLRKRLEMKGLLTRAHKTIYTQTNEKLRGKQLELLGFKRRDALHIACAESDKVDIFLTTDDRLLRRAQRYYTQLHVRVENPYTWLQEVD
ncbi:MAG: PIN domain-containing protein [Candidatus Poribacteria bacterium]|nr:PIN domain-containing protein [Candidatus Poribacteria bacterium]